ncbi:MAG: LysR family transcriptional regulator [Anaeromyxobacteraceae bacterium]
MPSFAWDDLRVALAVQRRGSHGGAARVLGVDTSTVGRRLSALEAALGARLFNRTPAGLLPTREGAALLVRAARVEEEALAVEREVGGADARVSGSVRLTASDGLLHHLLLPALGELRRAHPGLTLELRPDALALDLARREADVAVRLFRPRGGSLVARRLGTLRHGLFASREYLERRGAPREARDLADHDHVGFDASLDGVPQLRRLRQLVPSPRWAVRSTTTTAQVLACLEGAGIAMLGTFIARREPRLVPVLPSLELPSREVWLAYHEDLRGNARVAAVQAWLRTAAEGLGG